MAGAADGVTVSTAGGNEEIAADVVSGVKLQRIKAVHGIDGVNDGDVARTNPLPVQAYLESSKMHDGATQLTPKFAVINLTATGTLVAAVASKKIRVLALFMTIEVVTGDETYTFKSGAAGTALTGAIGDTAMTVLATVPPIPIVMPFNPLGWFETTAGVLLELSLAGTTPNAQGNLVYVEV